MAALLLRRASTLATRSASYSLIPFAVVRPGSSSYVHNRPFASLIPPSSGSAMSPAPDISDALDKIESLFVGYSNGLPLPNGFPFDLSWSFTSKRASLKRWYGKEMIFVEINCDEPLVPIKVYINTKSLQIIANMTCKPGQHQLNINEVTVRPEEGDTGDYKDYLQTKGITPKTISLFYHHLGYK